MAEELKTVQRNAVGGPNEHKTAVNGALSGTVDVTSNGVAGATTRRISATILVN